jgi:rare lipoprotein A
MNIHNYLKIILPALFFLFALTSCTTTHRQSNSPNTTYKPGFYQKGLASYYDSSLKGHKTANGERYDPDLLTAANKTLPINTIVKVTAMKTGLSVVVRINDRGPYAHNRIIDLSEAAAKKIGIHSLGVAMVSIYIVK